MTILELKELIRPLSEDDKQGLKRMLDEQNGDDAIYHLGELAEKIIGDNPPPPDFAENFREYTRVQKITHD